MFVSFCHSVFVARLPIKIFLLSPTFKTCHQHLCWQSRFLLEKLCPREGSFPFWIKTYANFKGPSPSAISGKIHAEEKYGITYTRFCQKMCSVMVPHFDFFEIRRSGSKLLNPGQTKIGTQLLDLDQGLNSETLNDCHVKWKLSIGNSSR